MWNKQQILNLIDQRPQAVNRAVLALYKRQSADERSSGQTLHSNGVGFNANDASVMSYYAGWIERHGGLTGEHLERARTRIRKYAGQLAEIANERTGFRIPPQQHNQEAGRFG